MKLRQDDGEISTAQRDTAGSWPQQAPTVTLCNMQKDGAAAAPDPRNVVVAQDKQQIVEVIVAP